MFGLLNRKKDPEYLEIAHNNQTFRVTLKRRTTSRRMILRLSRVDGEAILSLPPFVSVSTAKEFVSKQAGWLETRKAHIPAPVFFNDGALIPIRGKDHLIVRKEGRGTTKISEEENQIPQLIVFCSEAHVARRIKEYLLKEAKRDLEQAAQRHAKNIDKHITKITLRDTRSRWGACSSSGSLSFSWRLIMAPPFVLNYLAAHEVAHLREMNHSSRFWKLTHELCPDTDRAEKWLKISGSSLHRYGAENKNVEIGS